MALPASGAYAVEIAPPGRSGEYAGAYASTFSLALLVDRGPGRLRSRRLVARHSGSGRSSWDSSRLQYLPSRRTAVSDHTYGNRAKRMGSKSRNADARRLILPLILADRAGERVRFLAQEQSVEIRGGSSA